MGRESPTESHPLSSISLCCCAVRLLLDSSHASLHGSAFALFLIIACFRKQKALEGYYICNISQKYSDKKSFL